MKKVIFLSRTIRIIMGIAIAFGMTACSSDNEPDDGGIDLGEIPSLPTPEYESSSARYEITQSNSPVSSIELTASGDYVVITNPYFHAPQKASLKSRYAMMPSKMYGFTHISRTGSSPIIYGKFVKISDTEYILEGYGSIVIEGTTNNAFSLQITPAGGETTTVAAMKSSEYPDSPINNAICRTWNLDNLGVKMTLNGAIVYNEIKPANKWDNLLEELNVAITRYLVSHYGADADDFDPYEPRGYYPTKIIFTKAGTYMVEYSDGTLAISTWHWINEAKGQFQYSWDYDDPDSEEDGGSQNFVSFKGERLFIHEFHTEIEDDEEGKLIMKSETIYDLSK